MLRCWSQGWALPLRKTHRQQQDRHTLGDTFAGDWEEAAWSQVAPDGRSVLEWRPQPCVACPLRDGLLLVKLRFLTLYLNLGVVKPCF